MIMELLKHRPLRNGQSGATQFTCNSAFQKFVERADKPNEVVEVCRVEIQLLDQSKGAARGSKNPSLDQLIIDLSALYKTETGISANSHCYRDDTVEDGFNGRFFHLAKAVLAALPQAGSDTSIALGKRINRVLERA